jgi:hypothetical protein
MKKITPSVATLALLALAVFGCSQPTSGSGAASEPRVEIYQGDDLQASYTLSSAGKVLSSRSLGAYGDWSGRSYEYDSDGQVRSVAESFDVNTVKNSRSISSSRALSRSGKVQKVQYTVTESSNVLGRAATTSDSVVSYNYDDNDDLVSIVKEDEYGNQEVKNVGRPCYSATEIESGDVSRALGGHNRPTVTARKEIAATVAGRSPGTASGGFEGCYVEYGADVLDFRPEGIGEAFSRGAQVSETIAELKEGQVFIDESGTARKLLSIEKKGSTLVYHTRKPGLEEVLTDLYLPPTSCDFNDMDPMGEYMSDKITVTQTGSAAARAIDGNWKLDTSELGTRFAYIDKVSLNGGGAATFSLELAPTVNLALDYCYDTGTKRHPDLSWVKLDAQLGMEVLVGFAVSGKWDSKIPIYVKGKKTTFATMQFGLFFIPYFKGELSTNLKYQYVLGYKNEIDAWVGPILPQSVSFPSPAEISNSMTYGFDLKAEMEAGAKLLALGGEMSVVGITLVESYPGAGVYASVSAEMHMAEQKVNGISTKKEAWIKGSGEIGAFIEASISFWNGKFSHTFLEKKWPFASFSVSKGSGNAPVTNPRNPGVAISTTSSRIANPDDVIAAAAEAERTAITLSWIDPSSSDLGGVEIVCDDASVPTRSVAKSDSTRSRSAVYEGLSADKTYAFTLTAVDTTGEVRSAGVTVSGTTYTSITHPKDLQLNATGQYPITELVSSSELGLPESVTRYVSNWWPVKVVSGTGEGAEELDGYWWSEESDYLWQATTAKYGLVSKRTAAIVRDASRDRWASETAPRQAVHTSINHPDFFTGKNYSFKESSDKTVWRYRMTNPSTGDYFYPKWDVIEIYDSELGSANYYWHEPITDTYYLPSSYALTAVPRSDSNLVITVVTQNDSARWSACMFQNPSFPETLTWSEE